MFRRVATEVPYTIGVSALRVGWGVVQVHGAHASTRLFCGQVAEITAAIVDVRAAFALLAEFRVQVPRDKLELEWEAYRGPQRIAIRMAEVRSRRRFCCWGLLGAATWG